MSQANFYSSAEASKRGFDVLDVHFHPPVRAAPAARRRTPGHTSSPPCLPAAAVPPGSRLGRGPPCCTPVNRWIRDDHTMACADGQGHRGWLESRGDSSESTVPWCHGFKFPQQWAASCPAAAARLATAPTA